MRDVFEFQSVCANARSPKELVVSIVDNIHKLCYVDMAIAYILDGNGKVCDQYLWHIDERWSSMYLTYYADTEGGRFSCDPSKRDIHENPSGVTLNVRNWKNVQSDEFVPQFIQARGLKYSCGFALFDMHKNYRAMISLDRLVDRDFSEEELEALRLAIPMLNNLHKNFYYAGFSLREIRNATWKDAELTMRETEIADLLCKGISVSSISRSLCITKSTTYRHIANIYKKLQISSQQELLVRLMRQTD